MVLNFGEEKIQVFVADVVDRAYSAVLKAYYLLCNQGSLLVVLGDHMGYSGWTLDQPHVTQVSTCSAIALARNAKILITLSQQRDT